MCNFGDGIISDVILHGFPSHRVHVCCIQLALLTFSLLIAEHSPPYANVMLIAVL